MSTDTTSEKCDDQPCLHCELGDLIIKYVREHQPTQVYVLSAVIEIAREIAENVGEGFEVFVVREVTVVDRMKGLQALARDLGLTSDSESLRDLADDLKSRAKENLN